MEPSRPLNYRSAATEHDPQHWRLIWIICLVAGAIFLALLVWGAGRFSRSATPAMLPPAVVAIPSPGIALGVVPAGDATLKAAAAAAKRLLDDLLSGKLNSDPNLGRATSRFQNFNQWTITSAQKVNSEPPSITFTGTLVSSGKQNSFTIQMVQQQNGAWKPSAISGPNSK